MKEFGTGGHIPQEQNFSYPKRADALTSQADTTYARSGAKSMDGNAQQENPIITNPREATKLPPQEIINPSIRRPQRVTTSTEARLASPRSLVDKRGNSQWSREGKLSLGFDEENPYTPQELAQRAQLKSEYERHKQGKRTSAEHDQMVSDLIDAHGELPVALDWEEMGGSGAKFHNAVEGEEEYADLVDYAPKNERERPENLNEFLYEIMRNSDPKWGPKGTNWLMRKNPETGKVEINQANFLEWQMDRMVFYHGEDPDNLQLNLFQKVRLERDFRDITILDMFENEDRYFKDSEGNMYKELANEGRLRFWQFAAFRSDFLEYNLAMGDDGNVNKVLAKQFYNNSHSKIAFHGQSVLTNILTMAHKFDSKGQSLEDRRKGDQPERPKNDTNLGNAVNTSFLIYYNIGDHEKLKQLLGDDVKYLLNADYVRHEIIKQAASKGFLKRKLTEADLDANGNYLMGILTPDEIRQVKSFVESTSDDPKSNAGFLFESGDIKPQKIIDFINLYNQTTKHPEAFNISRGLVQRAIQSRYNLGESSTAYAEQMAFFMARPMGAGWRNDMMANANDATTKVAKMRKYREKMASGSRAGMYGNPYSMYMLKSALVDYLTAARTNVLVKEADGETDYKDAYDNTHYYSIMELMEKLHHMGKNENGDEKAEAFMETAKDIIPTVNSERQWAQDHMNRAFEIYHDVVESNEIDWAKFTDEDAWGNIKLNRGAFEKEVKDHFFKIIRYCYSTYDQLDFSKTVRYHNPSTDKWEDQPLVVSLFGKEILDIPEFWKKDYARNPDGTIKTHKVKDPHGHGEGKEEPVIDKVYEHVIDPQLIQQQKELLWKQVALGRLAADIYAHRDYFSTDKPYNMLYFEHMIEAIETISDGLMGDEDNLRVTKRKGHAFSHSQIAWLRKTASIERWRLYRNQVISDLFGGIGSGLSETIKKLFGDITKIG